MRRLRTRCKMAVLHVNTCAAHSGGVTGRIARFISDTLGIPFIHNVETAQMFMDTYDVLWVLHGTFPFSKHRDYCVDINARAREVVWVQNDHAFKVDSRMKHSWNRWWTTVERNVRLDTQDEWINWNRLTWEPDRAEDKFQHQGLMYYGSCRPDRLGDFKTYLRGARYPMHVVGYPSNLKKFHAIAPSAGQWAAFKHVEQLRAFQASLYLQDRHNDTHYGCPANRFYEMLYTGIPMIFDSKCRSTFDRARITEDVPYDITPYMVNAPEQIPKLLCDSVAIGREQYRLWARDYRAMLLSDFELLCRKAGFTR
jgi:hypothetical protein